jgi:multicomponent Na+:H+ antiporter subunit E
MCYLTKTLALASALGALWLGLSAMFDGLLLVLGVASSVFAALIAKRMDLIDRVGHPIRLNPVRLVGYAGWLVVEVIKSNIDVARLIWSRKLAISPVVVRVRSSQKSKLAQVIFANSITLTPGTVSINLWRDQIRVHALTRAAAEALQEGHMDARVTELERQ